MKNIFISQIYVADKMFDYEKYVLLFQDNIYLYLEIRAVWMTS